MVKHLAYRTSYLKDQYVIYVEDKPIGKVYKPEWLGCNIEGFVEAHQFRFVSQGFLNTRILIYVKGQPDPIARVVLSYTLRILSHATLTLSDQTTYCWTKRQFLSRDWQWKERTSAKVLVNATEPWHIFRNQGTIEVQQTSGQDDLLVVLGIYLRARNFRVDWVALVFGLIGLLFIIKFLLK